MKHLSISRPPRRPLKVFASDPMGGRTAGNRVTVDVANEDLAPGPRGERLEVIDYDASTGCYYPPVHLDEPHLLLQGSLDPSESDPRFHQQMTYAVAMRTLENFDRALGRRVTLATRKHPRLRILPHAFHGANAFYSSDLHALLFGYFRADQDDPGPNLPGQNVFTCLSHDIVAHEMTHALVDRLRPHFLEPTSFDVPAFHEGFSDIVALFQHFSFRELLRDQLQRSPADLGKPGPLVELARQFGHATGGGRALRSALDDPTRKLYRSVTEPHERGAILVAAVFGAFFSAYQKRIRDLVRIATGGSGRLPEGDMHPDLVNRIAAEAAKTAAQILSMCIRAFDYLPPVDITFGDYLRALVTADLELVPDDFIGQREGLIESFRMRGIYPDRVRSLAEESLVWEAADADFPTLQLGALKDMLAMLVLDAAAVSRASAPWSASGDVALPPRSLVPAAAREDGDVAYSKAMAVALHGYARRNAARLHLDPRRGIRVRGFHSAFRVGFDGRLLIELVAQFTQKEETLRPELGGLWLRGGTTVVANADGRVRYVIAKPLPSAARGAVHKEDAGRRLERQREFVRQCDLTDPALAYGTVAEQRTRMLGRMSFAALHQGGG